MIAGRNWPVSVFRTRGEARVIFMALEAEASVILKREKIARKGDRFVVSGGAPLGKGGEMNFVMVRTA